ncbi:MAG: transposase [Spirochaetales bacterium]|nr:transposase [Spirochaetales bacterium]
MRRSRKLRQGAVYHVIARANRNEFIFESKEIRDMFLDILSRAKKRYKFAVWNFCIMGTHVHLMMQPLGKENLSKIMQWILSVFARKFNDKFNLIGHVWYDRFKSWILNSIHQMFVTFQYITENPVKAGIVKKPEDYEHNGITFIKKGMYDIIHPPGIFTSILT